MSNHIRHEQLFPHIHFKTQYYSKPYSFFSVVSLHIFPIIQQKAYIALCWCIASVDPWGPGRHLLLTCLLFYIFFWGPGRHFFVCLVRCRCKVQTPIWVSFFIYLFILCGVCVSVLCVHFFLWLHFLSWLGSGWLAAHKKYGTKWMVSSWTLVCGVSVCIFEKTWK